MKLYIAGDHFAAGNKTESGWAKQLNEFISPNIEIVDESTDQASTSSFVAQGRLFKIETDIKDGDHLLVQFGFHDALDVEIPYFVDNLQRFITVTKSVHQMPIFLTPIYNPKFSKSKQNQDSLNIYIEAMRKFCHDNDVALIDIFEMTKKLTLKFSEKMIDQFYLDDIYLTTYGSRMYASIIANELKKYI
jgi:lysophospholipase L1-like esterase